MPTNIRTFIAVRVNATSALRDGFAELKQLGPGVKPVRLEGLHITLKFTGGTDSDLVPLLLDAMREAVAEVSPFEIELRGLGAFPNTRRPSVIWVGVVNREPLAEIAERLETLVTPLGFARENRSYKPHLTLARINRKPPPGLGELFESHQTTDFGRVAVEGIQLYQSETSPGGARYMVMGEAEFGMMGDQ